MSEVVRLGDVCNITTGQSAPQGDDKYCTVGDGGIPFIKAGNLEYLSNGGNIDEIQAVNEDVVKSHRLQLFPKNTVVFAKSGMSSTKGYIYVLKKDCYVVSHLACITPKKIQPNYLKYYFKAHSPKNLIQNESYPSIKVSDIEKIRLHLPTDEEQQRIVQILDTAGSLIDARKKQIALLDEAEKSLFVEMFGDPETNPMGWEIKILNNLTRKITDGVHLKPNYTQTGVPFISVVNITTGKLKFDNCKFVSEEDYEIMAKSTHAEYGDILYTKVGATYGIPALVDTHNEFGLYVSVCLIKPKHDVISNTFLLYSLSMPYVKKQAEKKIKGIGVPDLHLKEIKDFNILVPPRDLQNLFTARISAIEEKRAALNAGLAKMEEARAALMQEYFG